MDKTHKILSENKLKATPQRMLVFSLLDKSKMHLNAEEIYEMAKKSMPAISFATVYAILRSFKDAGIIRELRIDSDRACFEVRLDGHHHFFCEECGAIFDIDIPLCSSLKHKEIGGNEITRFEGYFHGICKSCKGTKVSG